jgi:hypothetical protein
MEREPDVRISRMMLPVGGRNPHVPVLSILSLLLLLATVWVVHVSTV